jgi:hypothetical protein
MILSYAEGRQQNAARQRRERLESALFGQQPAARSVIRKLLIGAGASAFVRTIVCQGPFWICAWRTHVLPHLLGYSPPSLAQARVPLLASALK